MILFFYNLALMLALIVTAPWWLWQMFATEKYREGLAERLGFARQLKGANGRPAIWIHAVSVGEVLAVSRLVQTLDNELPDHFVVVSTTTRTGQKLARERFGWDRVFYCPLDLPWAAGAILKARKPAMLVLAETEFWPNLLQGCFSRGIPVVVVNARISDRSWPRYRRLRGLWRPMLGRLTAVLAQSGLDADRLRDLGCRRVSVTGNLKFDVKISAESTATEGIQRLNPGLRLLVAGSTLEGEEALLLEVWPEILRTVPDLAMILAPRHPERFAAVAGLLERSEFAWRKRSAMGSDALLAGEVVLLDSIGELASVNSLATVAFVGGSLVSAGGHNPLEPAQFGVPVAMGEHYANFRSIVEAMLAREALRIMKPEELASGLARLIVDTVEAAEMGERGRQVFQEQAGATERTVAVIREVLGSGGAR